MSSRIFRTNYCGKAPNDLTEMYTKKVGKGDKKKVFLQTEFREESKREGMRKKHTNKSKRMKKKKRKKQTTR